MKRSTKLIAAIAAGAMTAVASAGTTFTWTGDVSMNWKLSDNWLPDTAWPGQNADDDIVIVRFQFGMVNMPEKPTGGTTTIAKLDILYNSGLGQGATVTVMPAGPWIFNAIKITERDGLTVETDCQLILGGQAEGNDYAEVLLAGGGNITLDGVIEFAGAVSELELTSTNEQTSVIIGSGSIRGTELGAINGSDVLVLGPDNAINGSVDIFVPLVNHGEVDPDIPGVTNYGDTITLYCEPKVGPGLWSISGSGSGQGEQNTMVIYAPVAGTGNLVVGANSVMDVHRHFSLYGTYIVGSGALIRVDQHIMFDVGRFAPEACPDE